MAARVVCGYGSGHQCRCCGTVGCADGSAERFGTYPTESTYNRPSNEVQSVDRASVWCLSPDRGECFPSAAAVVASGASCAFEAQTAWELKQGRTTVKSGSAMASSACPIRGTWKVDLGILAAGDYTFRMFEVSMKDGALVADTSKADTSKPFTVR